MEAWRDLIAVDVNEFNRVAYTELKWHDRFMEDVNPVPKRGTMKYLFCVACGYVYFSMAGLLSHKCKYRNIPIYQLDTQQVIRVPQRMKLNIWTMKL